MSETINSSKKKLNITPHKVSLKPQGTEYKCQRCMKVFTQKGRYTSHINRKNKCEKVEDIVSNSSDVKENEEELSNDDKSDKHLEESETMNMKKLLNRLDKLELENKELNENIDEEELSNDDESNEHIEESKTINMKKLLNRLDKLELENKELNEKIAEINVNYDDLSFVLGYMLFKKPSLKNTGTVKNTKPTK